MARMVYDRPTVAPQAGSPSTVSAPSAPMDPGAPAAAASGVLQKASGLALQIQDDIDNAEAKAADNALTDAIRVLNNDPDTGYLSMAGKDAMDGRLPVQEEISKRIQAIERNLATDMQRRLFRGYSEARKQAAFRQIDNHAMQQTRVYLGAEINARMKNAIGDATVAIDNGDTQAYGANRRLMLSSVKEMADLMGVPEDTEHFRLMTEKATTDLHAGVIDHLLTRENPHFAERYFEDTKGEIDKRFRPGMTTRIQNAVNEFDGKAFGNLAWQKISKGSWYRADGGKTRWLKHGDPSKADDGAFAPGDEPSIDWVPDLPELHHAVAISGMNDDKKRYALATINKNLAQFNANKAARQKHASSKLWSMYTADVASESPGGSYEEAVFYIDTTQDLTHEGKANAHAWARKAWGIDEAEIKALKENLLDKELEGEAKALIFLSNYKNKPYGTRITVQDLMLDPEYKEALGPDAFKKVLRGVQAENDRRDKERRDKAETDWQQRAKSTALAIALKDQENMAATGQIMTNEDIMGKTHIYGEQTDAMLRFTSNLRMQGINAKVAFSELERTLEGMKLSGLYPDTIFPDIESDSDDAKLAKLDLQRSVVEYMASGARAGETVSLQKAILLSLRPAFERGTWPVTDEVIQSFQTKAPAMSGHPAEWPAQYQERFVKENFFKKHHRLPNRAEFMEMWQELVRK